MEAKEEISDTDSGIILHSGPDSPCTVLKDVPTHTHTRAVRLKLLSLEERLEACVLELKKLCIREAELTGHLSSDFPLLPGEKPPQVRRRIGATFKLDNQSFLEKNETSALSAAEAELALQQQIVVAARHLCQEGALMSKGVRKSHQQQCRLEERKLKQLQEDVFQLRLQHGRTSPHPAIAGQRDQTISDDSSLSDSALLDEEERASQASQRSLEPPSDPAQPSPRPALLQEQRERHAPPQILGFRPPITHPPHYPLSPSLSYTHNHLPSPTRSPSLNHAYHHLASPIPSPSLNHTHPHHLASPIPSPSLNHTHPHHLASPVPSPSLNHTHPHHLASPVPSPSLNHTHILPSPIPSPSLSHTHSRHSPSPCPSPSPSLSGSLGGGVADERPPIEHSPWTESSLDQPYEKIKKSRSSSRTSSSPAVTPTLPPLQVCGGEGGAPCSLPPHVMLKPPQCNSAPCTPEMQLRRGLSLRLPSSDGAYDVDQERGRSRLSRRRVTEVVMPPEYSTHHVVVGNPLYHSSSEDSASEHSAASYASSPRHEMPADGPAPPHLPNGFYRNSQHQSAPSFSRAAYLPPPPPPAHHHARATPTHPAEARAAAAAAGRYDYERYDYERWHEEAGPAARALGAVPAHVRLGRAPSLREYPSHQQPVASARGNLPRQMVSEELKSWQQRHQLQKPRPRSLDRHRAGALRHRSASSRDSPLSQQPLRLDQPPQVGPGPRWVEQHRGPWTTEDDAHIISQV